MVQRYEGYCGYSGDSSMEKHKSGDYVKYSDYKKLEAENKELKKDNENMLEAITEYLNHGYTREDLADAVGKTPSDEEIEAHHNGPRFDYRKPKEG